MSVYTTTALGDNIIFTQGISQITQDPNFIKQKGRKTNRIKSSISKKKSNKRKEIQMIQKKSLYLKNVKKLNI